MIEPPAPGKFDWTDLRNRSPQFRKESRYKSPLAAVGYLLPEEGEIKPELVWLTNLSLNGLAFLAKNPYREGYTLFIHLPGLGPDSPDLAIEVMHSTQQINGDWLVGCRLATALTQEELEKCLTADNELLVRLVGG